MLTFLQRRAQLEETRLEEIQNKTNKSEINKGQSKFSKNQTNQHALVATHSKPVCFQCKSDHPIYTYEQFLQLTVKERLEKVKSLSLCQNCLLQMHQSHKCRVGPCKKCRGKHNSLLHLDQREDQVSVLSTVPETSLHLRTNNNFYPMLYTAIVDIRDKFGNFHSCRVLLDSVSQSHYITEKLASELQLKPHPIHINVTGLSSQQITITKSISTTIKSRANKYETNIDFLVAPRLTSNLPSITINRALIQIPHNIILADPEFQKPAEIDALIGNQLFFYLMCDNKIKIPNHKAILKETKLGWIVADNIFYTIQRPKCETCHLMLQKNDSII